MHIRQTPGAKIMASKGLQTAALTSILASVGSLEKNNINASDICSYNRCWESWSINRKRLQYVPAQLHHRVHERWRSFNGFQLLSLPFEIREMVARRVIGPIAEAYRRNPCGERFDFCYPSRLEYARQWSRKSETCSLALRNKQFYSEVMITFFRYTTLFFRHEDQFLWFSVSLAEPAVISPLSRINVRYIVFDLGPKHLLTLFHIAGDVRVGDSMQPSYNGLSARFQMCFNDLHLRRVVIKFPRVSRCWQD